MTEGMAHPVRSSAGGWGTALVLSALATCWLADVWDAQKLVHLAVWVVLGFAVLPLAFVAALASCGLVLVLLLGVLSLPARLAGRRVGLTSLARELWSLAAGILPDYWRALRAVRKPWLWGTVLGFLVGVAVSLLFVGLQPA